jgi:hypothetical protein
MITKKKDNKLWMLAVKKKSSGWSSEYEMNKKNISWKKSMSTNLKTDIKWTIIKETQTANIYLKKII